MSDLQSSIVRSSQIQSSDLRRLVNGPFARPQALFLAIFHSLVLLLGSWEGRTYHRGLFDGPDLRPGLLNESRQHIKVARSRLRVSRKSLLGFFTLYVQQVSDNVL